MRGPSFVTNIVELLRFGQLNITTTEIPGADGPEAVVQIVAGPMQFTAKAKAESITGAPNPRAVFEDFVGEAVRNSAKQMREHLAKEQNKIVVAQEGDVPPAPAVKPKRPG